MALTEENLLVLAVKGTPFCDATFEHAADAVGQEFQAEFILEVLENRHRHDAGHFERLQHVGDVFVSQDQQVTCVGIHLGLRISRF
jgi:hypothetical protein